MLKRYFLFIVFLSVFSGAKAQTYSPFVVDSAVWVIQGDDIVSTLWIDNYWGYYMHGDTIVNSLAYKKIYSLNFRNEAPNWGGPLHLDSMNLCALVRESAKRIYALDLFPSGNCPSNSEYVLFDYNYNIGDTVNLCIHMENPDIVSHIDTINYNRKNFITASGHDYIEGIGTEMGLFERVFTSVSGGIITSLYSYCQGNLSSCNISTNTEITNDRFQFNVYPNPSAKQLNMDVSPEFIGQTIKLYNSFGQLLAEEKIADAKSHIDTDYPSGVYQLALCKNGMVVTIKKVIVINP